MKPLALGLSLLLLSGCAALGLRGEESDEPRALWNQAHVALSIPEFAEASTLFERLAQEFPGTEPGRESLFYLATIRLDPRNPEWGPEPAEDLLERYLASSETSADLPRRPEAQVLLQLARQLNLPVEERVPGLQAETTDAVQQRVVVPARQSRELAAEVARLRQTVAEREATIQQQKEELERIRKTLTGSTRGQ